VFKRGFKSWCERIALEKRAELGLDLTDPLKPESLAADLGITIWTPSDVPGLSVESLRVLVDGDPESWSAVTLRLANTDLIIVNSAHSHGRLASNLMHELAHVLLGHTPTRVDVTEDQQLLLRTHDPEQEEEASWLAGCLLLPRPCLVSILRRWGVNRDAARQYGVSLEMLTYRIRVTGVEIQARRYHAR
jgi:Zn-dependent peptidase ImmA (M78 family)